MLCPPGLGRKRGRIMELDGSGIVAIIIASALGITMILVVIFGALGYLS